MAAVSLCQSHKNDNNKRSIIVVIDKESKHLAYSMRRESACATARAPDLVCGVSPPTAARASARRDKLRHFDFCESKC